MEKMIAFMKVVSATQSVDDRQIRLYKPSVSPNSGHKNNNIDDQHPETFSLLVHNTFTAANIIEKPSWGSGMEEQHTPDLYQS